MAALHSFCPGYTGAFKTLVNDYPGSVVYPPAVFRTEWGPMFHRGRLNNTAKLLVIGQDPAAHENVSRRVLVGVAGVRLQGFLQRLGIRTSYVIINTFLYSLYDQNAGNANDPAIAAYRNRWLNALLKPGTKIKAVVTLGTMAEQAWNAWKATPAGAAAPAIVSIKITHPTADSHPGNTTAALLQNWNNGLQQLGAALQTAPTQYSNAWNPATDLVAIPEGDLPPGLPEWMRWEQSWAERFDPAHPEITPQVPPDSSARYKRRHILLEIPSANVP